MSQDTPYGIVVAFAFASLYTASPRTIRRCRLSQFKSSKSRSCPSSRPTWSHWSCLTRVVAIRAASLPAYTEPNRVPPSYSPDSDSGRPYPLVPSSLSSPRLTPFGLWQHPKSQHRHNTVTTHHHQAIVIHHQSSIVKHQPSDIDRCHHHPHPPASRLSHRLVASVSSPNQLDILPAPPPSLAGGASG